jgi:uncharacterized membrane protein
VILKTIILCELVPLGLLMAALGMPLMRRKIAPNSWYGFRVRRTLEDPKVWYDANEFTGRCLIRLGIGISLFSLALYYIPAIDPVTYATACGLVLLAGVAVSVLLSFRHVKRMKV